MLHIIVWAVEEWVNEFEEPPHKHHMSSTIPLGDTRNVSQGVGIYLFPVKIHEYFFVSTILHFARGIRRFQKRHLPRYIDRAKEFFSGRSRDTAAGD